MRNIICLIAGIFIGLGVTVWAGNIATPPASVKDVAMSLYFDEIYRNWNAPEITTTAPNGTRTGKLAGEIVIYNNSGTFELWANTDGGTTWQQL